MVLCRDRAMRRSHRSERCPCRDRIPAKRGLCHGMILSTQIRDIGKRGLSAQEILSASDATAFLKSLVEDFNPRCRTSDDFKRLALEYLDRWKSAVDYFAELEYLFDDFVQIQRCREEYCDKAMSRPPRTNPPSTSRSPASRSRCSSTTLRTRRRMWPSSSTRPRRPGSRSQR